MKIAVPIGNVQFAFWHEDELLLDPRLPKVTLADHSEVNQVQVIEDQDIDEISTFYLTSDSSDVSTLTPELMAKFNELNQRMIEMSYNNRSIFKKLDSKV